MGYLIPADYDKQIQAGNLTQILGGNTSIKVASELAAQEEISSYLVQKYDLAREFTDTPAYDATLVYKAKNRVYDNSGKIYNGAMPFPEFQVNGFYNVGDQVWWKDKTYTCQIATSNVDSDVAIQYGQYENLPATNVFPDDTNNGANYWGNGTDYNIGAGTVLTDPKWTAGDNRNPMIVTHMVSITLYRLHFRISPRNTPEHIQYLYHQAIDWLEKAAKGTITANIPVLQPRQGSRIRFGGNVKLKNSY